MGLSNYVLLSPDALPLKDKDKRKTSKYIANDPLSLIEYWSIDQIMMEKYLGVNGKIIGKIKIMIMMSLELLKKQF